MLNTQCEFTWDVVAPNRGVRGRAGSSTIRNLRLVAEEVCECESELCESPAETVKFMAGAFAQFPDQEQFWMIPLNRKNRALGRQLITVGTVCSTLASPREVFRAAILASASGVVVVHNHPSGDSTPSAADIRMTRTLKMAGEVIDIPLLDHVVIGDPRHDPSGLGYYSFRQAGMI